MKNEYEKIKTHFHLNDNQFFLQENHYFDTVNFELKENKSALRIRKKENQFELTLKQPIVEGLLETNQILTETEANFALYHNQLPNGSIVNLIKELNIDPSNIHFFGTLKTNRAEWEYKNGLLVLDYSSYLNTEDYELEYEVSDRDVGRKIFLELLSSLNIPVRKTENKIKRFYLQKQKK